MLAKTTKGILFCTMEKERGCSEAFIINHHLTNYQFLFVLPNTVAIGIFTGPCEWQPGGLRTLLHWYLRGFYCAS